MTNEHTKQKPQPYSQVLQWVAEGKEIESKQGPSYEWCTADYDTVLSCAIHGVKSDLYLQPKDFRLKPERHIHQDLIDAYAKGAKIQFLTSLDKWEDREVPLWHKASQYRIKPEPKPDTSMYAYIVLNEDKTIDISHWTTRPCSIDNLKVVFCGETNKIKSVEII